MLDHIDVGGFPEVQSLSPDLRVRVLQDYVHVVVLRDVIDRHQVANPGAVRALVRQLLGAPAAPFSVHKAFNDLKSQGFRLGKDTVYEYFRARMTHPRKCYLIDPGLARAFSYRAAGDVGRLLENVVYLELRRRGYQVNYAVTSLGREIDFVARRRGVPDQLIQVCADLGDPKTRERELGALSEGLRERPGARGTVVSLHDEETLKVGRRTVRIVPAWRWLLTS
jgi:predicted AAA+ superfamily ATPase